jgi:HlyD family secretion protein
LALVVASSGVGLVVALRPTPVPVDVGTVARGSLVVSIVETGVTRVKDRYVVSSPVTGSLSRVAFEPGDVVKEGDTLAEVTSTLSPLLDDRTRAEGEARLDAAMASLDRARAEVARATVAKDLADRKLERTRLLQQSGSIANEPVEIADFEARMRGEELSSATFASRVATEEVRVARSALSAGGLRSVRDRHVDIVAPISGRVLAVRRKSEGVVQSGTQILEIGDPSALEVVVDLLTTDAVNVHPGTKVRVQGWGGDVPLEGRVRLIEPSAFTKPSALGVDEQRVNVVVALTDAREKWASLGDGYRVEAEFVLWRGDDVLKVAQGAVFRHGDHWASFRIDDDVATLVPVVIGHRGETETEILSGLAAGARVAVHPGDRIKPGVRVEAR